MGHHDISATRRDRRRALGFSAYFASGLFLAIALFFVAMGAVAVSDDAPFWVVVSWFVALIVGGVAVKALTGGDMTSKPKSAPATRRRVRFTPFFFFRL